MDGIIKSEEKKRSIWIGSLFKMAQGTKIPSIHRLLQSCRRCYCSSGGDGCGAVAEAAPSRRRRPRRDGYPRGAGAVEGGGGADEVLEAPRRAGADRERATARAMVGIGECGAVKERESPRHRVPEWE